MMAADPRGPVRVIGRYALYNEIAAGGMATVHIGRLLGPVGFARTVAVKRLHPQFAKDPEFVSGFLDEARLAARVQHPNVVATIDVVATDGELFLIMDYVRGESLSKLLRVSRKQGRTVPPRIAAAIMCGFLHGLHAAHEAKNERGEPLNLVHRDVSPQNVLVGSDGIARVLDFGVAKAAGRVQVTRDGQIKGKLAYMPPEQLAGHDITRAVDVYAAAVVMWETLTGERLFKGETESETLAKILRDPVYGPSMLNRSIPVQYDPPLLRALNREPARRHQTAKELALEIERCAGIASPTEVGEWVEALVGPILTAREQQIAEIESHSTAMRIPAPEPDSTSDVSRPYGPASGRVSSGRMPRGDMPSGTMPMYNSPHRSGPHAAAEEPSAPATGSKWTGSLSVPVDRKLPVLASILGVLVLAGIVAAILLGKAASDAKNAEAAAPSASVAPAVSSPPAAAVEPPAPAASEAPAPSAVASAAPSATTAASTPPATTTTAHATWHPPPPPQPTAKATATATAKPTGKCDPPYTVDEHGRKKYKLECM
jgi:serine/threonine-protein kinase